MQTQVHVERALQAGRRAKQPDDSEPPDHSESGLRRQCDAILKTLGRHPTPEEEEMLLELVTNQS